MEQFDEIIKEQLDKDIENVSMMFANYLKHNKNVAFNLNTYSVRDAADYMANQKEFFNLKPLCKFDDESFIIYDDKLKEVFINNLSEDVVKISCPSGYIKDVDLSKYHNLKEIDVNDFRSYLSKQDAINILSSSASSINIEGAIDSEFYKDKTYLSIYGSTFFYDNDRMITTGTVYVPDFIAMHLGNDKDAIKTALNLLKKSNLDFKEAYIAVNEEVIYNSPLKLINKGDKFALKFKNIPSFSYVYEIIKQINNSYDVHDVSINIEGSFCNDVEYLKKINDAYNLDLYMCINKQVDLEDYLALQYTMDYYKELINGNDLSPLEKATFAYDLVKSFEYKEVQNKKNRIKARNVIDIVKEGNIVCVGYSEFYAYLLSELGILASPYSTTVPMNGRNFGHQRVLASIKDSKYNIDGVYAFDPTWDSTKNLIKVKDKDGNVYNKRLRDLTETDVVLKYYDNMSFYKYFLVTDKKYDSLFIDENKNDIKLCKLPLKEIKLSDRGLSKEKFEELMHNIKLYEGYTKENVASGIEDMLELSGYITPIEIEQSIIKR